MKFSEMPYERPSVDEFERDLQKLAGELSGAERKIEIIGKISAIRRRYDSMRTIAHIRHTINTEDPFYREEQRYFDLSDPRYDNALSLLYRKMLESRDELESAYGKQIFLVAELRLKTTSDTVIEDLKEENTLVTRYRELLASARFVFEGRELTLPQLGAFLQSTDRDARKRASSAISEFFMKNKSNLDDIYDRLVKKRGEIAEKLGFKNFVGLGYARMLRSDYGSMEVTNFRKKVEKSIVPFTLEIREKQRNRLGLRELLHYDEALWYKDGNATPDLHGEELLSAAMKMYGEMSTETSDLFSLMVENDLIDWGSRRGKAQGGYTTFIDEHNVPFIFANFNGTEHDVNVLTHEFGHSLQSYLSRSFELPEYRNPTYEICEMHSMGMEFLAHPWMDLFFRDAEKYRKQHYEEAFTFIPYACLVDHFQQSVYENPELSPEGRNELWRKLEQEYMPYRDYDDEFLEKGGYWYRQRHIFERPFYYIDYAIAQLCALELFESSEKDRGETWRKYISLCSLGGSRSFSEVLSDSGLKSPFREISTGMP